MAVPYRPFTDREKEDPARDMTKATHLVKKQAPGGFPYLESEQGFKVYFSGPPPAK